MNDSPKRRLGIVLIKGTEWARTAVKQASTLTPVKAEAA